MSSSASNHCFTVNLSLCFFLLMKGTLYNVGCSLKGLLYVSSYFHSKAFALIISLYVSLEQMGVVRYQTFSDRPERSLYPRLGGFGRPTNKLCTFYLAGKCNRNPCRFVHDESRKVLADESQIGKSSSNYSKKQHVRVLSEDKKSKGQSKSTADYNNGLKNSSVSTHGSSGPDHEVATQKKSRGICEKWLSGKCLNGDKCQFLHSWFSGDGIINLAKLAGHKEAVSGIALGFEKLYSGSKDGTARLWDCHSGQCANEINLGAEVGSLICEGRWVFVGMPNLVKAWNIESSTEFNLYGPVGQVHCMDVGNGMLFAGTQDGTILAWKSNSETSIPFQAAGLLKGHSSAVICLRFCRGRLYSGSLDNQIRVWDINTMKCLMTLDGHTNAVTSLISWDSFLLSCSLDRTIKVWVLTEDDKLEVTYTHNEEHGVLKLYGMIDTDDKPVLFCTLDDNSIRLYDLPSFMERGRIFSKSKIEAFHTGPHGLFFTGDRAGMLNVWKLSCDYV